MRAGGAGGWGGGGGEKRRLSPEQDSRQPPSHRKFDFSYTLERPNPSLFFHRGGSNISEVHGCEPRTPQPLLIIRGGGE